MRIVTHMLQLNLLYVVQRRNRFDLKSFVNNARHFANIPSPFLPLIGF